MKSTKAELMFDKLTFRKEVEELENYEEFVDLIPEMKESGANIEAVKKYRSSFAYVCKMQKELGFEINYGYMCTELIKKYNAWKVVYKTNSERKKFPFRVTLNELELKKLAEFELICTERAINKTIPII